MVYKDIKGYESTHKISSNGDIVSKARLVKRKDGFVMHKKEKHLKWNYQKGYPTMCLYDKGFKRFFVHRLVYTNFVGEIPDGMQINHINGIKDDNRVENLELVTPKQNTEHAWKTGLSRKRLGVATSLAKLDEEKIRKIRKLYLSGLAQAKIAKMFGLHQSNVHYITSGKTWSHVA